MARKYLKMLAFVMMSGLLACAAPQVQKPETDFQPYDLSSELKDGYYIQKVQTFMIIMDASSSMGKEYVYDKKIDVAKRLREARAKAVGKTGAELNALHQEIRYLLSSTLQAVIAQRLIPLKEGKGRAPAVEVMVVTSAIREYIIDPEKASLIQQAIREGVSSHGMQSFDQSLMRLLTDGMISMEEALKNSTNPHEFSLRLKGIQASSDKTWDSFEDAESASKTGGDF